ncbi:MAG: hypothetical protein KDD67_09715 [Ignavibacteriae bacterium]|nr:hypothetical protein [Ignavibacteriota bacterium]
MTKQEKRYFKLYATFYTNDSDNRYTRLFDVMDKLDVYDQEVIERGVEPFLAKRYLAKSRHQLTRMILNSLAAYDAHNSTRAELREALAHIELLFNRGLYSHCRKAINKARTIALRYERFVTLIEILEWEYRLTLRTMPSAFKKRIASQQDEFLSTIKNLQDLVVGQDTMAQITTIIHNRSKSNKSHEFAKLKEHIEEYQRKGISDESTASARILYFQTLGLYYWIVGDHSEARKNYRTTIQLWDEHPALIRDRSSSYRRDLRNYLTCCFSLNDFADFPQILEKIKSVPTVSMEDAMSALKNVYSLELAYYLNIGELEGALTVVGEIEANLKTIAVSFDPYTVVSLLVNCAMTTFLSGRFRRAFGHIVEIENRTQSDLRMDLQKFTLTFSLILHYELENLDTLEAQLRRAQKFITANEVDYAFGNCVVDSMKRLINSYVGGEKEIFEDMWGQLLVLYHNNQQALPTGLTELLFWVESKLRGENIAELYSKRMRELRSSNSGDLFSEPAFVNEKKS